MPIYPVVEGHLIQVAVASGVTGRLPDGLAGGEIERRERALLAAGIHDHPVAIHQRRGACSPGGELRAELLEQVPRFEGVDALM